MTQTTDRKTTTLRHWTYPPTVRDWAGDDAADFVIGEQLEPSPREAMRQLLDEYPDVFASQLSLITDTNSELGAGLDIGRDLDRGRCQNTVEHPVWNRGARQNKVNKLIKFDKAGSADNRDRSAKRPRSETDRCPVRTFEMLTDAVENARCESHNSGASKRNKMDQHIYDEIM